MFHCRYNLMQKCWHVDPEKRPRFEYCLKVLKSYMAMPLDYVNVSHDPQLHNVSLLSEKYTIDLITCIDSQQKLSPISNYDGYEIPIKIINNEYLELCNDKCEYLDLSSTPTVNMVDNRDSEPESISEDNLYCNMNPELIG
ncbi:uncharacterized protein LOC111031608 [Myzus persicae]|uniref:uncharacterized protein LOC111031608 n=1 Tax=Myzus persicae TaxID=13164 RepID=UPI000B93681F|nr:uncharacterized protein LOC111031608 [Myzus persicae]